MKNWSDVKVGDTVYFSDSFAEVEPLKVTEICPFSKVSNLVSVNGECLTSEKTFRVISWSSEKSLDLATRSPDMFRGGYIWPSIEAYKNETNKKLEKEISDLERKMALIKNEIDQLKDNIATVSSIEEI